MADLTKLVDAYTETLLHPAVKALKETLPPEFFVVEHIYYPDSDFPAAVKFITDTKDEAEQWVAKRAGTHLKREKGSFPVRGMGNYEQVRIWTKIFESTGRKGGVQPISGLLYRIMKTNPSQIAIQLIK